MFALTFLIDGFEELDEKGNGSKATETILDFPFFPM